MLQIHPDQHTQPHLIKYSSSRERITAVKREREREREREMVVSYTSSEEMSQQNTRSHHYLHSLHNSSASKISKKPPAASLAPPGSKAPQPKIYKVKPIHFRELVQQLTGAPADLHLQPQTKTMAQAQPQTKTTTQGHPRRSSLQSVAPPPLPLQHHQQQQLGAQNQTQMGTAQGQQVAAAEPTEQKPLFGGFDSTTELTLSPNFQAWFSFAMLSPGPATASQMEQRAAV